MTAALGGAGTVAGGVASTTAVGVASAVAVGVASTVAVGVASIPAAGVASTAAMGVGTVRMRVTATARRIAEAVAQRADEPRKTIMRVSTAAGEGGGRWPWRRGRHSSESMSSATTGTCEGRSGTKTNGQSGSADKEFARATRVVRTRRHKAPLAREAWGRGGGWPPGLWPSTRSFPSTKQFVVAYPATRPRKPTRQPLQTTPPRRCRRGPTLRPRHTWRPSRGRGASRRTTYTTRPLWRGALLGSRRCGGAATPPPSPKVGRQPARRRYVLYLVSDVSLHHHQRRPLHALLHGLQYSWPRSRRMTPRSVGTELYPTVRVSAP